MTIHVRHIDEKTVEVTLTPSWLGCAWRPQKLCRGYFDFYGVTP